MLNGGRIETSCFRVLFERGQEENFFRTQMVQLSKRIDAVLFLSGCRN
jgi:hypothetical protein